jgi:hypothetical protein
VSTTEELLGRKSSGSGLENRYYGRRDLSRWPRGTLYLLTLALTSPTSDGSSVGIVRSRTKATELLLVTASDERLKLACYHPQPILLNVYWNNFSKIWRYAHTDSFQKALAEICTVVLGHHQVLLAESEDAWRTTAKLQERNQARRWNYKPSN